MQTMSLPLADRLENVMFTFFFVVSVADESDEESEKTVRVQINEWMDASDFKATPTNKLDVSKTE